jgi:hypothetical protein
LNLTTLRGKILSTTRLRRHLGKHMEQIALFVVPGASEDGTEEENEEDQEAAEEAEEA